MAAEDLLVHVHIDKTAGTAVWNWFGKTLKGGHGLIYPKGVPGSYFLDEAKLVKSGIGNTQARSLSSHYFRVFPAWSVGRRMHYFTLLREPLAQYLSYCNYARQIYREATEPEFLASVPPDADRLSAREFTEWLLAQPNDVAFRENFQTNYLTSYVWRESTGRGPQLGVSHPSWEPVDWAAYRGERVELGKQVLREFVSVGIVERLGESLTALAQQTAQWGLHLGPVDSVERVNVTHAVDQDLRWIGTRDSVGRQLLESLEDDRELHAFAEQLLDAGLRAAKPSPGSFGSLRG